MRFRILPKLRNFLRDNTEIIEAENKDDAIVSFAENMDMDMNQHFMPVCDANFENELTNIIVTAIEKSQLSADNISEIFQTLKKQNNCIGGKIWTVNDFNFMLHDMHGVDNAVNLTDEQASELAESIDTDILDDTNDSEWGEFEDAVNNSDITFSVSVVWDIDTEDILEHISDMTYEKAAETIGCNKDTYANMTDNERYDYIDEYVSDAQRAEILELPDKIDVSLRDIKDHADDDFAEYLADEYAFCVKSYTFE